MCYSAAEKTPMIRKVLALLCALNLSGNLMAQPPDTVLDPPASSGSGRQFWNLVLRPVTVPVPAHRTPARLILSAHGSLNDAEWCLSAIRDLLRSVPADVPVYIWLEHAYPTGIPDTLGGLQQKIPAPGGTEINWRREFTEWPLPHETEMALREPFEKARQKEKLFPGEMAFHDGEFMKKIYRELMPLRGNRNLRIKREEPSFGAYLEDLRRDLMGHMTTYWLDKNRKDLALASLALAYRNLKRSLWIRDHELAASISQVRAKNPESLHFIVRGLAHIETLGKALSSAGIGHENSLPTYERSPIEGYLIRHGALPSADSVPGVRFLNEELSRLR
jgi:hypothetical protein